MDAVITVFLAAASYLVYAAAAAGHYLLLGIGNSVRDTSSGMTDELLSPLWLWIIGAAFALFIFYWESFLFFSADKRAEERFFSGDKPRLSFRSRIIYCLTSPDCLIRLAVSCALSLIVPLPFGFIPLENQAALPLSPVVVRIVSPFAVLILGIASYNAAFGYWIGLRRKKDGRQRRGALRIILYSVFYVLAALIIPAVSVALAAAANIIIAFWFIPALLAAGAAVFLFIRTMRERKARENAALSVGASATDAKNSSKSGALSGKAGESFFFTAGGKKYGARFVGCPRKAVSFFFESGGKYTRAVTVSIGRLRLFHRLTEYDYTFECEGQKIIVVSPAAGRYYLNVDGAIRTLASGEKIGEYLFLDSDSLKRLASSR